MTPQIGPWTPQRPLTSPSRTPASHCCPRVWLVALKGHPPSLPWPRLCSRAAWARPVRVALGSGLGLASVGLLPSVSAAVGVSGLGSGLQWLRVPAQVADLNTSAPHPAHRASCRCCPALHIPQDEALRVLSSLPFACGDFPCFTEGGKRWCGPVPGQRPPPCQAPGPLLLHPLPPLPSPSGFLTV